MKTKTTILVMILIGWATCLLAQVATNTPPATTDMEATDAGIHAFLTKYSVLKLFLVPLITVGVMGLKKVIGAIPIQVWPYVTPFLGTGLDYLGEKAGIWSGNAVVGAAMGGLAVWFHQIGAQAKEFVKEGSTRSDTPQTPTSGR